MGTLSNSWLDSARLMLSSSPFPVGYPELNCCVSQLTFKKEVTDQSKMLLDGQQWAACVDHVMMAWSYVRATPVWDNPAHNNVRRGLFKALAANCLTAAKKGKWTPAVASELKEK